MYNMNKFVYIAAALFCIPTISFSQTVTEKNEDGEIIAGYFDSFTGSEGINFASFKLPPLEILFSNARTNPSIELLAKEEQLAKELLKKEKTDFLSHITGHGSYSYGIMDNYGSNSSVVSPIYYQYMGSKQSFWNIGASVNFSVEDIFEIKRKIKRQKLEVEKSTINKDIAYETLKQQIVTLYVQINNDLIALKTAAENAASYKGAGMLTNEEFKIGEISVRELAETKRWENDAVQNYQRLQTSITTNILILEIITHTPIITNIVSNTSYNNK